MKRNKTKRRRMQAMAMSAVVLGNTLWLPVGNVSAATNDVMVSYEATGASKKLAGYAEGTITLKANTEGTYYLYWADDKKVLPGFYPIEKVSLKAKEEKKVTFGYHTAIPAGATKLVVMKKEAEAAVEKAVGVYELPIEKQLTNGAGKKLYSFNSYSDIHIDQQIKDGKIQPYYQNSKNNWKQALNYAAKMDTDFIVSAGDNVTNATGVDNEWSLYLKIFAESDYTKPLWETNGNHDMRNEKDKNGEGLKDGKKIMTYSGNNVFVKKSGTDSTIQNTKEDNQPYYYKIEENTGDVFIFMALENGSSPGETDNFSKAQLDWVQDLLDTYYGTGVNVYLIEHATFRGFGPGDIWRPKANGYVASYYGGHMYANDIKGSDGKLKTGLEQNTRLKNILTTYKDIIWMSGHTHQDFEIKDNKNRTGLNYTNENGAACNMIHNPSVAATTYINEKNELEYDSSSNPNVNDGKGKNSQGYYVETYENAVVYYGANLTDEKIYPTCCYIMEGSRQSEPMKNLGTGNTITPKEEKLKVHKTFIQEGSSLDNAISAIKSLLSEYVKYASYDQYQNTKNWYYIIKSNQFLNQAFALSSLEEAAEQLYTIANTMDGKISVKDAIDYSTSAPTSSPRVTDTVMPTSTVTTTPTGNPTPTVAIDPAGNHKHYAISYYIDKEHDWTNLDTYLSQMTDGSYMCELTTKSANKISLNVYNAEKKEYNCVAEHHDLIFEKGEKAEYQLKASTTKGSSITIDGLATGNKIRFTYYAGTKKVVVECVE